MAISILSLDDSFARRQFLPLDAFHATAPFTSETWENSSLVREILDDIEAGRPVAAAPEPFAPSEESIVMEGAHVHQRIVSGSIVASRQFTAYVPPDPVTVAPPLSVVVDTTIAREASEALRVLAAADRRRSTRPVVKERRKFLGFFRR